MISIFAYDIERRDCYNEMISIFIYDMKRREETVTNEISNYTKMDGRRGSQ